MDLSVYPDVLESGVLAAGTLVHNPYSTTFDISPRSGDHFLLILNELKYSEKCYRGHFTDSRQRQHRRAGDEMLRWQCVYGYQRLPFV